MYNTRTLRSRSSQLWVTNTLGDSKGLTLCLSYSEEYELLKKTWVSHGHPRTFLQAFSIYQDVCVIVRLGCLTHQEARGSKKEFISLFSTIPQTDDNSQFHCWPHCLIVARPSGLPFQCVCIRHHIFYQGRGSAHFLSVLPYNHSYASAWIPTPS